MTSKTSPKNYQNDISVSGYFSKTNLKNLREKILEDVLRQTGFKLKKNINESTYWGKSDKIGAFHCEGNYQGKRAVLKIQGVKPVTSEIFMIKSFEKYNQSKLIRPPRLYESIPWSEKKQYEALILEYIDGEKIISLPTNRNEVDFFYKCYLDYKKNCLNVPWLKKPKVKLSAKIIENFSNWKKIRNEAFANNPLRKKEDANLIESAIKVLVKEYENVDFEFMHGHFSQIDLYKTKTNVVLLSNLFWAWHWPFRDAVFAYHWFTLSLENLKNYTFKNVLEQKKLWLDQIFALPFAKIEKNRKLIELALLERAAAGLNLDGFLMDPKNKISHQIMNLVRKDVLFFLSKYSSN